MSAKIKGTIERLGGKPWWIKLTIPGVGRRRIRLPKGCSEALALERCAYYAELAREGKLRPDEPAPEPAALAPVPKRETIAGYAERWIADRARRGLKRTEADANALARWVLAVIGPRTPVVDVTTEQLRAVVAGLDEAVLEERLAWKTATTYWGLVTKLFDDAAHSKTEALRVRSDNPTTTVRGPDRGILRASAYLYPTEALQLFACRELPMERRIVYAMALCTGLRRGELRALRAGDVSLAGGYLLVARSVATNEEVEGTTKSKRARRVPIEPVLRPLLTKLVQGRAAGAVLLPQLEAVELPRNLRRDLRRAGVLRPELFGGAVGDEKTQRPITFHDLRHTYATWLALRGEPALVIQQRLGHSDAKMTGRYIEAAEEVGRGAIGSPFPELPLGHLSKSFVHEVRPLVDTTINYGISWRAREDSNL